MAAYHELEERKPGRMRAHTVLLDNRERAVITGVQDVDRFNETEVMLLTDAGALVIEGQNLHISRLNLDEGQLIVDGLIIAVEYCEGKGGEKNTPLFARIFR